VDRRFALLLALLGGFLPAGSHAATVADAPKDALDEVIINARREKLSVLQKEIEKTEDRFIEAYNRINTKPEYQISCSRVVRTGTWISVRECKPKFVDSATEDEAREYQTAIVMPGAAMPVAGQAELIIAGMVPAYQKHLLEVINKNANLRGLIHEQIALEKHYQEVRRMKFKGHWVVRD
jgi:hypothetical protein